MNPILKQLIKVVKTNLSNFILVILSNLIIAQNSAPIVENVVASQRTDGSKIVDIYYDVSDTEGDLVAISLLLSDDGGETFTFTPTQTSGDVGFNIQIGTNKHIIWEAGISNYSFEDQLYQFKIIADDLTTSIDIDGNVYSGMQFGSQIWMAENLKVSHYNNGDEIPTGFTDGIGGGWSSLSYGAYCMYENNEEYAEIYGYLYNWYAINDDRGICPEGWHVPNDSEFVNLFLYLGVSESVFIDFSSSYHFGNNEGSMLAGNSELWNEGDLVNNDGFGSSGFSALPGGVRGATYGGGYGSLGYSAKFWSSSIDSYSWQLYHINSGASVTDNYIQRSGLSVRCVRD